MSDNTEKLNEEIKRLGQTTGLFADVVKRLDAISKSQQNIVNTVDSNVREIKKVADTSLENSITLEELVSDFNEEKRKLDLKITSLESKVETLSSTVRNQTSRFNTLLLISIAQIVLLLVFIFFKR